MKDEHTESPSTQVTPMLINASEAAKRLGFCKRIFLEAVERGEIRAIKRNGRLWFREAYLEEFIQKMEEESEGM